MGLLSSLFGGGQVNADPNPGIGGYTAAPGPAGQTGYPGSTAATRENPQAGADKQPDLPVFSRRVAGRPVGRRPIPTITAQQAQVIPAPAENGGFPYNGKYSSVNPNRVRDTEKRPRIIIGQGTPGGENQRNTVYYGGLAAQPGTPHTYLSAPKGGFDVDEVTVENRYVFGGVNGGTDVLDDLLEDRRMPYTGHGNFRGDLGHARGSVRGAVLDGARYYQAPDTQLNQGGAIGRHRVKVKVPTIYAEPAPWSSEYYVTTPATGTPDRPGTASQVVRQVQVSPQPARRPGWRRG